MPALTVDVEGAIAFGKKHPDWYIFPGNLLPDGTGGWFKRPLGKYTRDATRGGDEDAVRAMWTRLVGSGKAIVCVWCQPSGIWVLDDDRDLPHESGWPALLEEMQDRTLVLRSCTKGRPHYVFKVDADGLRPKEGRWAGGDVKSSGIVFIGAGEPITDVPPTVAPASLLEKLSLSMKKGGGAGREAVSSEEMWDWITGIGDEDLILRGEGPEKFLGVVLQRLREDVANGDHRRQAALRAVYAAAKEAQSGFYKADDAYWEIREVYKELRDEDGSWNPDRSRDFDLMWSGIIAAINAGDLDDEIQANREAVGTSEDEEILELLEVLTEIRPAVKAMPEPEPAPLEPDLGLDWSAISDSDEDAASSSDETPEPDSGDAGDGGGDDDVPRAWDDPDPEPEKPKEPADPRSAWAAPAEVPPLASTDGERPRFADDSPVWSTIHGKLAKALSSGAAEVSDVAMLAASLTFAGTHLAGRGTHYIGADAHNPVVWSAMVGRSAAARKSMSMSLMQGVYYGFPDEGTAGSDPRLWEAWLPRRVGGFNSGEVLIDSFKQPERTTTSSDDDEEEDEDDGFYYNPRAIAVESELDRLWTAAGRDGSVLGVVLCNAWDGSTMAIRSRGAGNVEIKGGEYVLGLLGAATESRALGAVARGDGQMAFSGLANRYLWWLLPDETSDIPMSDSSLPWPDIHDYRDALELRKVRSAPVPVWGKDPGMTDDATDLWHEVYPWVKRGSKMAEGELAKETLSRAEAQVRRLALNFALSRPHGTLAVDVHDLQCALAVWEYCRASVRHLLAPERAMEAPSRFDNEVRRAMYSLLSDKTNPGWMSVSDLADALRKDRGTIAHHIKRMTADGLLVEGAAITGRRGKPPRVVAMKKRLLEGTLHPRAEGKGGKSGVELRLVRWED